MVTVRYSAVTRAYASKTGPKSDASEKVSSSASQVKGIVSALRSMMQKDKKVGKNDMRVALKSLKELDPESSAQVLKSLSLPLIGEASALVLSTQVSLEPLRASKMGSVVEESLARLLEVGFDRPQLAKIFAHLAAIYPEWRVDGWDNVIERFVINKGYDAEEVAFILSTLPRDPICDFSVSIFPTDLIAKYHQQWMQDPQSAQYRSGTPESSLWPASFYGRILGKFAAKKNVLDESAIIIAHMTFHCWNQPPVFGPTHPHELFVSATYFAAAVLGSLVPNYGTLSNPKIAQYLAVYDGKLLSHLRANPDIVANAFNTYEYLEWLAILISETSKRRGSKFNDIFMIKKCLDVLLEKWGTDDVALVSGSISQRFGIVEFVKEMLEERQKRL
jgi:hypothetical protein